MQPRISPVLNNCALHTLTPEIKEAILYVAENGQFKPELMPFADGYIQLKNAFAKYYELDPNLSWQEFANILKSYNAYDVQIILGPVFRELIPIFADSPTKSFANIMDAVQGQYEDLSEFTKIQPNGKYLELDAHFLQGSFAKKFGIEVHQYWNANVPQQPEKSLYPINITLYLDHVSGLYGHWELTPGPEGRVDNINRHDTKLREIASLFGENNQYKETPFDLLKQHVQLTHQVVNKHLDKTRGFIQLLWTVKQIQNCVNMLMTVQKKTVMQLMNQDKTITDATKECIQSFNVDIPQNELLPTAEWLSVPMPTRISIPFTEQENEPEINFKVSPEEWALANKELAQAPEGEKLRREYSTLKHSFIKINGKIYCLASPKADDPIIKYGVMSRPKYALDESGGIYIIKIEKVKKITFSETNEVEILDDLTIGLGSETRLSKQDVKKYSVIKYLGKNLSSILERSFGTMSEERRFDLAIQLVNQGYCLHHGLLSKTNTGYAHRDLKPDNITIDKQDQLRFIDFGFAIKNPFDIGYVRTAAACYTAYLTERKLTAAEIDVIALKRILYLPTSFYCSKGYTELSEWEYAGMDFLLPKEFLDKHDLNEFINTVAPTYEDKPDYPNEVMDSTIICAALINAKEKLGINNAELRNNLFLCHAIMGVYFSDMRANLKDIVANEQLYKLAGAMHYAYVDIHKNSFNSDAVLMEKIGRANNLPTAYCLLKLKEKNLNAFYDVVIDSKPMAELIELLDKKEHGHLLPKLLSAHSELLEKHLKLMCNQGLMKRCELLIDNPELVNNLEKLPADIYNDAAFIYLLKDSDVTAEQIMLYCQDENVRDALNYVLKSNQFLVLYGPQKITEIIGLICTSATVRTVIHEFPALEIDTFQLIYYFVNSEENCQAFICVLKTLGADQLKKNVTIINTIVHSKSLAQLIIQLDMLQWKKLIPVILNWSGTLRIDALKEMLENKRIVNQLTELMFLDETMLDACLFYKNRDDAILCLITLYNKHLLTKECWNLLQSTPFLFAQVSKIAAANPDWITESTLNKEVKSVQDFVLNIVSEHPEALEYFSEYAKNRDFMLDAMKKNMLVLKYAPQELLADKFFMKEAVKISYQAFKKFDKNKPKEKLELKREILHYQHASKNTSRFHLFAANLEKNDNYKNKTGDALKTAILKEFKKSLEGKSENEINAIVEKFKDSSQEYKVLCKGQGLATRVFGLETTSALALEQIVDDALAVARSRNRP